MKPQVPTFVGNREALAVRVMKRVHPDHDATAVVVADQHPSQFAFERWVPNRRAERPRDRFHGNRRLVDALSVEQPFGDLP